MSIHGDWGGGRDVIQVYKYKTKFTLEHQLRLSEHFRKIYNGAGYPSILVNNGTGYPRKSIIKTGCCSISCRVTADPGKPQLFRSISSEIRIMWFSLDKGDMCGAKKISHIFQGRLSSATHLIRYNLIIRHFL